MTTPNRTTSEIARRFAGGEKAQDVRPIARRLENWGNIGLLTPVGERHTGRGRARAYDEHEQIKAGVLLLTFAFQGGGRRRLQRHLHRSWGQGGSGGWRAHEFSDHVSVGRTYSGADSGGGPAGCGV